MSKHPLSRTALCLSIALCWAAGAQATTLVVSPALIPAVQEAAKTLLAPSDKAPSAQGKAPKAAPGNPAQKPGATQKKTTEDKTPPAQLGTVIVSVEKHPLPAQEVPRAMTILDQEALASSRIQQLGDVANLSPNTTSTQAGGVNTLSLRGIGGGGRNIGFDPRVGVYVDGVYVGQAAALSQPLFGISQIVILRGPQGHLFGRNSVAGAINLTTMPPPENAQGEFVLAAGSHGTREGTLWWGGPVATRVRLLVGAHDDQHDGFTQNNFDGTSLDDRHRQSARARLDWEASDRDTVSLALDRAFVRESSIVGEPLTGFFGLPLVGGQLPAREVAFNSKPFSEVSLGGASLTWSHLDDAGRTWSAILGKRSTQQERFNDTDYTASDMVSVDYKDHFKLTSLEARMSTRQDAKSRGVVGVSLLSETADSDRIVLIGNQTNALISVPNVPVQLPFGAVFGLKPGLGARALGTLDTRAVAVFGTWDYDVSSRFTTHLGGRVSREEKTVAFSLDGSGSGKMQIATIPAFTDSRTETHFSPMVGVSFQATPNTQAYATYSTGYKSGGWNLDFLNRAQAQTGFGFDDEKLQSLEVGIKGNNPSKTLSYDVSVFQARMEDFQVSQFVALGGGGSVAQLRNAAQAKSRGIELQGDWRPNQHVSIGGFVGLLDAHFVRFPDAGALGVDFAGNRLPDAPRKNAGLKTTLSWTGPANSQWDLTATHRYRSEAFMGPANAPNERLGARHTTDLRLDYLPASGKWRASAFIDNATDEQADVYRNRDFFGQEVHKRLDPRTAGVEVAINF